MQCIWTSVSTASRHVSKSSHFRTIFSSALLKLPQPHSRSLSTKLLKNENVDPDKYAALASTFVQNMLRDTSIAPTPRRIHSKLDPEKRLNAARLSRIAAQSVRLGCQEGNVKEPMIIIKALRNSVEQYGDGGTSERRAKRDIAIDFGQTVSPRLAVHALLHGLLRAGMTKRAGEITRTLLGSNIQLHRTTLRIVTKKLSETDAIAIKDGGFRGQLVEASRRFSIPTRKFIENAVNVRAPCTNLAVDLFFVAKQYQRQRARQMFQQLIDACLLQGEILVLTFLFAFLIIRWQYRKAAIATEVMDERSQKSEQFNTLKKYESLFHFWFNPRPISSENRQWLEEQKLPAPNEEFVIRIMTLINAAIFDNPLPNSDAIRPSFEEATQALAVLASMLEDGILPFNRSSTVIAALVDYPSEPSVDVWSFRNGEKRHRSARDYFDEVLDGLLDSIRSPGFDGLQRQASSLRSCNALLNYSLHRKLSPAKGAKLVNWMLKTGGTVKPDIVSYNTLLRSAIRFRRDDMVSKLLDALRQRPENQNHAIMFVPEPEEVEGNPKIQGQGHDEEQHTIPAAFEEDSAEINHDMLSNASTMVSDPPAKLPLSIMEDFDVDFTLASDVEIHADNVTLTIYLTYLTGSGRPETVNELIYSLIPELETMDLPLPPQELDKVRSLRETAMRRAIALGPFFFTAVLNALRKTGQTKDAEQVWLLAKRAEKFSWHPQYADVSEPWALPIAAYTSMMQCYAREARRASRLASSESDSSDLYKDPLTAWGWGRFVRENVKRKEKRRVIGGA